MDKQSSQKAITHAIEPGAEIMESSAEVPAVELHEAVKTFGTVQALKGINLTVQPGEVVALLGPNGAGKTTAISLMLGLRAPTKGYARVFGQNPRLPSARTHIGAMLQESGLPAMLKVHEVIELVRRLYPHPFSTEAVIEMAQLGEKAHTIVGKLSGGQRQRLYFALAIAGNPDVLFLDEPTVAMDVEARRNFWEQIDTFVQQHKTILLTTHNLQEADALAQRIIVINKGVVVAEGSPEQIKRQVGGKHIRFRATELRAAELSHLPGVQSIHTERDLFDLVSQQPELTLAQIFQQGIEIRDLEVVGAGLEEAFISITHEQALANA